MKTMAETASSQDPILVTPEVNLVRPTAPVVGRLVDAIAYLKKVPLDIKCRPAPFD